MSIADRLSPMLERLVFLWLLALLISGLALEELAGASLAAARAAHEAAANLFFATVYLHILLTLAGQPKAAQARIGAAIVGLVGALGMASVFLSDMLWLAQESATLFFGVDPHAALGAAMLLLLGGLRMRHLAEGSWIRLGLAAAAMVGAGVGLALALGAEDGRMSGATLSDSPLSTPAHLLPAWYAQPFYTALRAAPEKTLGVVFVAAALAGLALGPWLHFGRAPARSILSRLRRAAFALFALCLAGMSLLAPFPPETTWGDAASPGGLTAGALSLGLTLYALGYLYAITPLLSLIAQATNAGERPDPDVFA